MYIFPPTLKIRAKSTQKDLISLDPDTHGAMFIPIILGSDKTTVSITTGQHEYHPVYLLIGNVRNHI